MAVSEDTIASITNSVSGMLRLGITFHPAVDQAIREHGLKFSEQDTKLLHASVGRSLGKRSAEARKRRAWLKQRPQTSFRFTHRR